MRVSGQPSTIPLPELKTNSTSSFSPENQEDSFQYSHSDAGLNVSTGRIAPNVQLLDAYRQHAIHAACGPITVDSVDPHSFSNSSEVTVNHMSIEMTIDRSQECIEGRVTFDITSQEGMDKLHLDSKDLTILEVIDEGGNPLDWTLGEEVLFLGQDLSITIPPGQKSKVVIRYKTSQDAEGLYWSQDQGDFLLYSHSQPNYTRSWLPCQDSPNVRTTFDVTVATDPSHLVVFSSCNNPQVRNETGIYKMKSSIPIPSYLMAFSIGNFEFEPIGENTGIYAHPNLIEKASNEFKDLEKIFQKAQGLFGEYLWGRYDMLILPLNFPAGAVENPMISFFSSMVMTGDRSLIYYLYHELAHSWSGNCTTAVGWEHLWLNEGMTTYFEIVLSEEMNGKEYADMISKTCYNELQDEINSSAPQDTLLRRDLRGRNPRDSFTSIAYYKGYFFLKMLEEHFGKENFLSFLQKYLGDFKFQSVSTEQFESLLINKLFENNLDLAEELKIKEWLYQPGLPENCPIVTSLLIDKLDQTCENWLQTNDMQSLIADAESFTPQQWIYFIQSLNQKPNANFAELEKTFKFENHHNLTIRDAWLTTAVKSKHAESYDAAKAYVLEVGKPKTLAKFLTLFKEADIGIAMAIYKEVNIYEGGKPRFSRRCRDLAQRIIYPLRIEA